LVRKWCSSLIATPLTVWIMTAFGWKPVFYFYGVLGILWAGAWLLYSTETPSEHKHIRAEDLREIEASQTAEAGLSPDDAPIRSRAVWGLATAYGSFTSRGVAGCTAASRMELASRLTLRPWRSALVFRRASTSSGTLFRVSVALARHP
jgi:hypothetical protein